MQQRAVLRSPVNTGNHGESSQAVLFVLTVVRTFQYSIVHVHVLYVNNPSTSMGHMQLENCVIALDLWLLKELRHIFSLVNTVVYVVPCWPNGLSTSVQQIDDGDSATVSNMLIVSQYDWFDKVDCFAGCSCGALIRLKKPARQHWGREHSWHYIVCATSAL